MRGKLSLVLLTVAILSVAGVAVAQPCEPMCGGGYTLNEVDRSWDLSTVVPFLAVGAAVALTRLKRP